MPEYHNIEAYADLGKHSLDDVKNNIARILTEMGCEQKILTEWLNTIQKWEYAEDGIVYSGSNGPLINFPFLGGVFQVRFVVLGWTPQVFPKLTNDWLAFELLFETDKIDDTLDLKLIRYKQEAQPVIWYLLKLFAQYFPDLGAFFTDEYQDGRVWHGIAEHVSETCWDFEAAIIQIPIQDRYKPVANGYFSQISNGQLHLARKSSWEIPPWQNDVED